MQIYIYAKSCFVAMVLESITTPGQAEAHPFRTAALGFVYVTCAIFLSIWIFEEHASLVMVFLTVGATIPLFYSTMIFEEAKDAIGIRESTLLKEHSKAIWFFMSFFIGLVAGFALWYVVLPADASSSVFRIQSETITSLNQQITGGVASINLFSRIFLNNLKVLIFAVLFAFIYGSGAIFILTWNASVIGTAMGSFIVNNLATSGTGFGKLPTYFYAVMLSIVRYFIHGLPEILSYFVAALAGGVLSAALVKKEYRSQRFEAVLLDASDLILISVLILFVAGLVEVYVTPAFF